MKKVKLTLREWTCGDGCCSEWVAYVDSIEHSWQYLGTCYDNYTPEDELRKAVEEFLGYEDSNFTLVVEFDTQEI